MIDTSQLKNAIEKYNSSCSIEEFMMKLDLLGITIETFNYAYHQYIEGVCPMLFNILAGKDLYSHENFNAIEIGEFNDWQVALPLWVHFDGRHLKLNISNCAQCGQTIDFLKEYCVDPLEYLCYGIAECLVKNET